MAFRGTFDHTLDVKNRLTIPAKFRAALADGVVVALQPDMARCLALWRPADHERYTHDALAALPPASPKAAELRRYFFSSSFDTEVDAAGRVMMPAKLLERTGLGRELVVAGAGEYLEVWNREEWTQYDETLADTAADITASLGHPA